MAVSRTGRSDAADEPAATDLATVAADIAEEFPLVLDQTSLVLLDLDPGHLHAFWILASEDLHRANAAFRAGGDAPELVIRLCRLHPDGGSEILMHVVQPTETRGDARFELDNDDATYQAELGLSAGDGGWLLLARSNHARLPRPVGAPIPPWTGKASVVTPVEGEGGTPSEAPTIQPVLALVPSPGPSSAAGYSPAHEPATPRGLPQAADSSPGEPSVDASTHPPAAQPMGGHLSQVSVPDPGTRPARWVLAAAAGGGFPPDDARGEGVSQAALEPGNKMVPAAGGELATADRSWQPAIRIDWPWSEPIPPLGEDAAEAGFLADTVPWAARSAASVAPVSGVAGTEQAAHPEPPGPISSFSLGRGPEAPVIEAEVLVHISARPGTMVDLYGRPVRVGPSGRSTLRLPVTDLGLLTALLGLPASDG